MIISFVISAVFPFQSFQNEKTNPPGVPDGLTDLTPDMLVYTLDSMRNYTPEPELDVQKESVFPACGVAISPESGVCQLCGAKIG